MSIANQFLKVFIIKTFVFCFRVILDRAGPSMDDLWSSFDYKIQDSAKRSKSLLPYVYLKYSLQHVYNTRLSF